MEEKYIELVNFIFQHHKAREARISAMQHILRRANRGEIYKTARVFAIMRGKDLNTDSNSEGILQRQAIELLVMLREIGFFTRKKTCIYYINEAWVAAFKSWLMVACPNYYDKLFIQN